MKAGRRPRFLAKSELFENPFLRMVLKGSGHIEVRRNTGDQRPLHDASAALEAEQVVVVYPEGTSESSPPEYAPGRGKTGLVRLALSTGSPILPVATWGGQYVWRKTGRESLAFARPLWLKAGEPIDLSAHRDQVDDVHALRELTDGVMGELDTLVDELRAHYPRRWTQG